MKKLNIKEWYINSFPTDELGIEMNDNINFNDLFDALKYRLDVYEVLGVYDSIVRERVFDKLSTLMNVEYNFIYNLWLES